MPRFMSWLINRIRQRRFALSSPKVLHQFAFYYGSYSNWKHSPRPLIFVMHSSESYTHGIAIQYMNRADKAWFGRMLYLLKRGNQVIDGMTMYRLLKTRRYNIVRECYRLYFTSLLNMKMVGAGLTDRYKEVYEGIIRDGWLLQLNETLKPSAMPEREAGPRIAFSQTELRDRIIQAQNTKPIQERTARRAPWRRQPGQRAPWLK